MPASARACPSLAATLVTSAWPGGTAAIGPALADSALAPATPGTWNLLAGPQTGPAQVKAKLGGPRRTLARQGHRLPPNSQDNPASRTARPAAHGSGFAELMRRYADAGVEEVHVMPLAGDPAAFIRSLGDHVIARLP